MQQQYVVSYPDPRLATDTTTATPAPAPSNLIDSGLGLLMVLVALFVMFQYATSGVLHPDFHLHILNGEWILGHYALPEKDAFSWTAGGASYVLTQWGGEVLITVAWLLAGGWGTKVLTALVAVALLYTMHRAAYIQFNDIFGSIATTVLLAGGTLLSLQAQPEIFSYLLFAITVLVAEHWRENGHNRMLLTLPAILALWANMDSAFLIGVAYLWIATIGMGAGLVLKNRSLSAFWKVSPFAIAALAGSLATLINPYGVGAWDASISSVRSAASHSAIITDWLVPSLSNQAGVQLAIVMVMMAAVAGFSKRRLRVEEFLVFAAFLVFGFIARKNVPFFMIAMVPILSRLGAATTVSDWLRQSTSRKSSLLAQAFVIAIMLPLLMLTGVAIKDRGEKTFRRAFSVAALDFLVANKMTDRVMHGFDVGGYFAYSTGMKVFADRRTQLYGVPFVERYVNAMNGRPGYAEFIAAWNPKSILVPNDSPLKALLSATGQYGVVFDSGSDAILAKRGVGYDALITQYQHLPIKVALH